MSRLIDADKLEKDFENTRPDVCPPYDDNGYAVDTVFKMIDKQPTVDPVKYGHWIVSKGRVKLYDASVECSVCHRIMNYLYYNSNELGNFCKWCGVKMESVSYE